MYTYNAKVISVYDGDTITVDIDMGLYMTMRNVKVRMYGINAPEVKGASKPQGIIARDALRGRILGQDIVLQTIKDEKEKFGRWLGVIQVNSESINSWMIKNGYAVEYML